MITKCFQNGANRCLSGSRDPSRENALKITLKTIKRLQTMSAKNTLKSKKPVWVAFFYTAKNVHVQRLLFLVF